MNSHFMKKAGFVTSHIARDLLLMPLGERMPTIAEYVESLGVSRGIVQDALSRLEAGCVTLAKSGKLGTRLTARNESDLMAYTGWSSITASMPLPLNSNFITLAAAVRNQLSTAPLPFLFAYMTGSNNRLAHLQRNTCDFIIVSKHTADLYLSQYDYLEEVFALPKCIYAPPYRRYFSRTGIIAVRSGMRVALDRNSADQQYFTGKEFDDLDITIVDVPYTQAAYALDKHMVDCSLHRMESWLSDPQKYYSTPLQKSDNASSYPSILVNKNNYRMADLIRKYINVDALGSLQQEYMKEENTTRLLY